MERASHTAKNEEAAELLRAWQESGDASVLGELLARHVEPCLRDISLRRQDRWSGDAAESADMRAEVMLALTAHLRAMRVQSLPPIRDLRAYLTSAMYNAGFLRLRARSPRRARLNNRLRYALRTDRRFAIWESGHGLLAGRTEWSGQNRSMPAPEIRFASSDLGQFLEKAFDAAGGPLAFAALANLAAEAMGVRDLPALELESAAHVASETRAPEREIDARRRLTRLWQEVLALPAGQRAALLLNLRDADGQGVVELLPATGVADFAELAAALAISESQLARIWNDLPLEDSAIAAQMGVSRQQVINLRKSARARLARRFAGADGNTGSVSPSKSARRSLHAAAEAVRRLFGARGERP